jgi:outer membrane protein, multidrug efflux system
MSRVISFRAKGRVMGMLPLALVLAGCVSTPYAAPKPELAAAFSAQTQPRSAQGAWWASFRDSRLDQLIGQGLARNLTIQQAIAVIDEAEAGSRLAGAGAIPSVQAGAAASRADSQGAGIVESSSATLSTSWLIDIFGANRAARAAAVAELEAAKLSVEAAERAVTAAIAGAYIELRGAQESIALTRKSIASRRETLALTRSMQEAGQANRLDLLQAEQAVAQAEAGLPALEIAFDQALNKLATLTAQRSATLRGQLQKGGAQPVARLKPSVGLPAEVIRARPDVQIAERQLAAAVARVGVAEAAFWPSVTLSGSITPANIRGGATPTSWALGPQINLPIFTGGANKARLSGAESRAQQAEIGWRATVLGAIEEVENGLSAYNRGGSNVRAQAKLVSIAEQTVKLARDSMSAGQADVFTVLEAERSLLSARTSYAAAMQAHASSYVAISLAAAAPMR